MAVNFGSSGNTNRCYSFSDSPDFDLPDGDWTWLHIFRLHNTFNYPYIISIGGTYGAANSIQFYCNSGSPQLRVEPITEQVWGGGVLTTNKWFAWYGTRRNGNLYTGGGYLGEIDSTSESAGTAISGGRTPTSGGKIGLRSDITSSATYAINGAISDAIYIPAYAFSIAALRRVLSGEPLHEQEWWSRRRFHAHLRTSDVGGLTDITGRHALIRNGTGYGVDIADDPTLDRGENVGLDIQLLELPTQSTGGAASVNPTGITSGETFGTASISATHQVTVTSGISTAEAFGTAAFVNRASIACSGIASQEAFGSHVLERTSEIICSGIPSDEQFGVATVDWSSEVLPSGISSAEAFGSHVFSAGGVYTVLPTGISSAEGFGTHELSWVTGIDCTGIASAEAFGAATVSAKSIVSGAGGISSSEQFGDANLTFIVELLMSGIPSNEAFGIASLVRDGVVSVSSIRRLLTSRRGR